MAEALSVELRSGMPAICVSVDDRCRRLAGVADHILNGHVRRKSGPTRVIHRGASSSYARDFFTTQPAGFTDTNSRCKCLEGVNLIRLRHALRQPGFAQALYDARVLALELRVVLTT